MRRPSLKDQLHWFGRVQWAMGGAAVVLAGGFYLFAYAPANRGLDRLRAEIAAQTRQLSASRTEAGNLPAVMEQVESLKSRLAETKAMPEGHGLAAFLSDVTALQQRAGLQRFKVDFDPVKRGEQFDEQPITMTFEADYADAHNFLRHLADLDRLTRLRRAAVKAKEGKGNAGRVAVDLQVSIFSKQG